MESLFFWMFSTAMIVCGLAVILCRNPVASALCFAFCIFYMAALFVMLSAFFLAAVQILVTAGAVMVLFLFIIMLLNITEVEHKPRQKIWMGCTLVLSLGFIYLVARTLMGMPEGRIATSSLDPQPYSMTETVTAPAPPDALAVIGTTKTTPTDDTHVIGHALFTQYVAPFEVTSLLILVATIGVIVLSKQHEPNPRETITREAPPIEPKR